LPVAIHTVHTKATDNLGIKPDENGKVDLKKVPGHYQKAYRQVPEDTMQMEPATYSADNMATQDSPDLQGKETYQHPVRKALE
jgi:hypothetical protein